MYLLTTWLRSTTTQVEPELAGDHLGRQRLPGTAGPGEERGRCPGRARCGPRSPSRRRRRAVPHGADQPAQLRRSARPAARGRPRRPAARRSRARPSKRCRARSRHASQRGRPRAAAAAAASRSASGRSNTPAASAISPSGPDGPCRPRRARSAARPARRPVRRATAIRTAPGTVSRDPSSTDRRLDAGQGAQQPPAAGVAEDVVDVDGPRHAAEHRLAFQQPQRAARGSRAPGGRSMRPPPAGSGPAPGRRRGDRREVRALRPVQDDPAPAPTPSPPPRRHRRATRRGRATARRGRAIAATSGSR